MVGFGRKLWVGSNVNRNLLLKLLERTIHCSKLSLFGFNQSVEFCKVAKKANKYWVCNYKETLASQIVTIGLGKWSALHWPHHMTKVYYPESIIFFKVYVNYFQCIYKWIGLLLYEANFYSNIKLGLDLNYPRLNQMQETTLDFKFWIPEFVPLCVFDLKLHLMTQPTYISQYHFPP